MKKLLRNPLSLACLVTVAGYLLIALLAQAGKIASPWDQTVGASYAAPSGDSFALWLGTDIFGRSVLYKVIHATHTAISVGVVSVCISLPIGILLGSLAGYFGGWIDDLVVWFYETLASIPHIMLIIAIAYVLGRGMTTVYIALGITSWIGLARVLRGEFMKHRQREYVLAAESLGASHASRIFRHILPNVSHFVIINLSIQFMSAIKSEVILSFLGLGVQGRPSWGVMIDDAKLELARGVWWQLAGATGAMFGIVLALNLLGDALRDVLDPKSN